MKHLFSLCALLGILLVCGCRESDVRKMTVKVPAMASESDMQRVRQAVSSLNGVTKDLITFDAKEHTVTVTYDSMVVAHKNIEIAIAEAGFDANGIQAIRAASK